MDFNVLFGFIGIFSALPKLTRACNLLQVLSPKDTKELIESCPDAVMAMEEHKKPEKPEAFQLSVFLVSV